MGRSDGYWRKRRDEINKELGNDKPSIMQAFTVGFIDVVNNNGSLEISFIDYEKLLEIGEKYKTNLLVGMFLGEFIKEIKQFQNEMINEQLIRSIVNKFHEIYEVYYLYQGEPFRDTLIAFDEYMQANKLLKNRNMMFRPKSKN